MTSSYSLQESSTAHSLSQGKYHNLFLPIHSDDLGVAVGLGEQQTITLLLQGQETMNIGDTTAASCLTSQEWLMNRASLPDMVASTTSSESMRNM